MSSLTAVVSATAHATRRFLRAAPCLRRPLRARRPGERGGAAGSLLPSSAVTPLIVIAAGIVAIGGGTLLLRTYGPRVRVGRLLAVTPAVDIAGAEALAAAGQRRYVRIDGRIDADEAFPDEHARPLVFRRRRLEARLGGRWQVLDETREAVRFRVRRDLAGIDIDADALDVGLVTVPRESVGTAGDVPDRLPRKLPPATTVRLRIEQLSSVEHAIALGVPVTGDAGRPVLTSGTGRPLVVCTVEPDEAMRILAGGRRSRPIAAAAALAGGLALLAVGFGWALVAGAL